MTFKIKIISRYRLVEAAVSVMQIETMVKHLLDKLFKEENLPMPRLKIVSNIGSRWLGRCTLKSSDPHNTLIEIQKRITGDERTLERVVAHELIHHLDFMKNPPSESQMHFKWLLKPHGKFFLDWATKINAIMGKDFVTEKTDTDFITEVDRDYYVLIAPLKFGSMKGKLGWMWAARPSQRQKEIIETRIAEDDARLFKTRDERFSHGAKIDRYGLSYSKDEETNNIIKEMYEHGKQVKP